MWSDGNGALGGTHDAIETRRHDLWCEYTTYQEATVRFRVCCLYVCECVVVVVKQQYFGSASSHNF